MSKRLRLALALLVVSLGLMLAFCWMTLDTASHPPEGGTAGPSGAAVSKYPILIAGGDETSSGHVQFRLIGARLDVHKAAADGSPQTLALRVDLRATELMGLDTRVAAENVKLLASGRQLSPEKPFDVRLYASQSADLNDILFVVPASITTASLQIATSDSSPALIALPLAK